MSKSEIMEIVARHFEIEHEKPFNENDLNAYVWQQGEYIHDTDVVLNLANVVNLIAEKFNS